jgi:hypothetical protein
VLAHQSMGKPEFRTQPAALTLTAGMIWLINGLHNRPDDGFASRDLLRAILPHTDDSDRGDLALQSGDGEDEEQHAEETHPHNPCGMVFLRAIVVPPRSAVPRMRIGRNASDYAFKVILQMSKSEIEQFLSPPGILTREDIPQTRIPTLKRMTTAYANAEEHEEPLFTLGQEGHRLPSPLRDDGSDMDDDGTFVDQHAQDLDQKLTTIWCQFLLDLMAKRPNPKNITTTSYCVVTDCGNVKENFYQNRKLSDVWRVCQYRVAGEDLWTSTFSYLWPPKGHSLRPSAQNYQKCRYYVSWKKLIADVDVHTAKAIRNAMKEKFDTLYWIPAATSDKIWNTRRDLAFVSLPNGSTTPSPRLLIHSRRGVPQW